MAVIDVLPYASVEQAATMAADQKLASEVARVLRSHYAGWSWAVNADSRTGTVTVENWDLSERMGFYIRMSELDGPEAIKRKAVWAGGEFLERHGLPATKANEADRDAKQARAWFA
jgi:hypothetical protein